MLEVRARVAEQVRAVGVDDEIQRIGRAVRETEAVGDALAVLERGVVTERRDLGGADGVSSEAGVDADLEPARRAETLLADELGPDEGGGIGARLRGRVGDRNAAAEADGEAEALLDAGHAPLGVEADVAQVLRVEGPRIPARGAARPLRITGHQVDRQVQTDDDVVEEAEVELERPLEAVADEVVRLADGVVGVLTKQPPAVVDDEPEAHVGVADDVGPVGREEPLRVHRGTEEVGVEPIALDHAAVGARLRRRGGDRGHGAQRNKPSKPTSSHGPASR